MGPVQVQTNPQNRPNVRGIVKSSYIALEPPDIEIAYVLFTAIQVLRTPVLAPARSQG